MIFANAYIQRLSDNPMECSSFAAIMADTGPFECVATGAPFLIDACNQQAKDKH